MLASGYNPYKYAPQAMQNGAEPQPPAKLRAMAREAPDLMGRINYPWLRTIYPPLTQAAFAAAHFIGGYSLWAWRLVLLISDLLSLWLLYEWLRNKPGGPERLLVYWLNPLLLHEIYATCHMEVLLFPLLLGVLHLCKRRLPVAASALLGLGFGVKMWPILLGPAVLRPYFRQPLRVLASGLLLAMLCAAMLLPFIQSGLDQGSGLVAYSRVWEMNDAAYLLLLEAGRGLASLADLGPRGGHAAARVICAALILAWVLWLSRKHRQGDDLAGVFLGSAAALFFAQPHPVSLVFFVDVALFNHPAQLGPC